MTDETPIYDETDRTVPDDRTVPREDDEQGPSHAPIPGESGGRETSGDRNMTDDPDTLGNMDHTNPHTDRAFGETQSYSRGPVVAADGGEAGQEAESESGPEPELEPEPDDGTETLADVEHTELEEGDGSQRAFDRGIDR